MGQKKTQTFSERCFRDNEGRLTITQAPNLPIAVWFGALVLAKFTSSQWYRFFELISFGALFVWAWLEIFQGDNYFRRLLGVLVMTFTIWHRL